MNMTNVQSYELLEDPPFSCFGKTRFTFPQIKKTVWHYFKTNKSGNKVAVNTYFEEPPKGHYESGVQFVKTCRTMSNDVEK